MARVASRIWAPSCRSRSTWRSSRAACSKDTLRPSVSGSVMESFFEGLLTGQEVANEFNGLRTNFVIDHNGREWADFLLELEEELEKLKLQMEEAKRKGDWQKMSEIQYGKLPQLEAQLGFWLAGMSDAVRSPLPSTSPQETAAQFV